MGFIPYALHLHSTAGLLVLVSAVVAQAADGPDWPQFHGPAGDNISQETGLFPANKKTKLRPKINRKKSAFLFIIFSLAGWRGGCNSSKILNPKH